MKSSGPKPQKEPRGTWATSDYYLASYLMAHGIRAVGLDDAEPRRKFIFDDVNPKLRQKYIVEFRLGANDEVSATALFRAQKALQWMLRDAT